MSAVTLPDGVTDLTAAVERGARHLWQQQRDDTLARGRVLLPEWEDLTPMQRFAILEDATPLIAAALTDT